MTFAVLLARLSPSEAERTIRNNAICRRNLTKIISLRHPNFKFAMKATLFRRNGFQVAIPKLRFSLEIFHGIFANKAEQRRLINEDMTRQNTGRWHENERFFSDSFPSLHPIALTLICFQVNWMTSWKIDPKKSWRCGMAKVGKVIAFSPLEARCINEKWRNLWNLIRHEREERVGINFSSEESFDRCYQDDENSSRPKSPKLLAVSWFSFFGGNVCSAQCFGNSSCWQLIEPAQAFIFHVETRLQHFRKFAENY